MKARCVAAIGRASASLILATLASACTASAEAPVPSPTPPVGTVILDWTIDGAKDPTLCLKSGATTFNAVLIGSGGVAGGQWVQDCTSFATTIAGLAPDTYAGRVNLVDPTGAGRTTAVNLPTFHVVSGATSVVAIEFPRSSFF